MPSSDSHDLISLFVVPLNRLGVEYMVTGSLAAGTYGEPRLTNDVDVVIALSERDAVRLHELFDTPEFYVPPLEVLEAERRRSRHGHFNVIHHDSAFRADVYFAGDDPLHRWAFERCEKILIDDTVVWMAPPQYVIIRKLEYFRDTGSPKHLSDVSAMLTVLGSRLDQGALTQQINAFRLSAEWAKAQAAPA